MAEPLLGQISIFAGTFVPRSYGDCDGTLVAISTNQGLASLLGATYGGDGRTSFGLPDIRGRVPVHFGTGPGLAPANIGTRWGVETVTLTLDEMPSHNHAIVGSSAVGTSDDPTGRVFAEPVGELYYETGTTAFDAPMSDATLLPAPGSGGAAPHYNVMPIMALQFIIALQGAYPQRN